MSGDTTTGAVVTDAPTLFDPNPYSDPTKRSKRPARERGAPPRPDVIPVRTSSQWRMVSRETPGVVHAVAPARVLAAMVVHIVGTWAACGRPAVPMTFDNGQLAYGCAQCAARLGLKPSTTNFRGAHHA